MSLWWVDEGVRPDGRRVRVPAPVPGRAQGPPDRAACGADGGNGRRHQLEGWGGDVRVFGEGVVTAPFLDIRVSGLPVTQGSKKAFVVKTKAGPRAVMTEHAGGRLKDWRQDVKGAAEDAHAGRVPVDGPVRARIVFALPKPASAPKGRRTWPTGSRSGDLDKLVRAVFDALTSAGVWADDSRVVSLATRKDYPGAEGLEGFASPGVSITLWEVDPPPVEWSPEVPRSVPLPGM